MKILQISDKKASIAAISTSILYILTSILYFSPVELQHKICIPVATLALASLCQCPWQMTLALAFSATGDYFGSCDNFLAQMGCFAISHIWFIIYFTLRYRSKVEHDGKLTERAKGFVSMIVFCSTALLAAALTLIAPATPAGILRIGVIIYAILICTMLALSLLQRSSLFALGAVLFVFSDFILAWALFVGPIPHCSLLVMIPYYSAQMLFFIRSSNLKLKHPIRLMRF